MRCKSNRDTMLLVDVFAEGAPLNPDIAKACIPGMPVVEFRRVNKQTGAHY